MSRLSRLSTTSYAVLGLLSLRSWTTYELAQQMGRSLDRIWPRAESKVYEEPKKLVEHGLARAKVEQVGQRARTRYTITAEGPSRAEALAGRARGRSGARVGTAGQGAVRPPGNAGRHAGATGGGPGLGRRAQNAGSLEAGRTYAAGAGEFQSHVAQNMLVGGFLTELYRMVAEWADWATALVEEWPEDPAGAVADMTAHAAVVRRAEWSEGEP